jgi:hypothetical protein
MQSMSADQRVFWRSASSTVWVSCDDAVGLVFEGLDRLHLDGYEYSITVAPGQFAALRRALGVGRHIDLLDAVCAHVDDIMASGERSWLTDRGIEHDFNSV